MDSLLEVFLIVPGNTTFKSMFVEIIENKQDVVDLFATDADTLSRYCEHLSIGKYEVIAIEMELLNYKRCGYVHDTKTDKYYRTYVGDGVLEAFLKSMQVITTTNCYPESMAPNMFLLMNIRYNMGWVEFYWKDKRPAYAINTGSAMCDPEICDEAAKRLLCNMCEAGVKKLDNATLFNKLNGFVNTYAKHVTQYPGIGVLKTFVDGNEEFRVMLCELDGTHLIITKNYTGIAIISRIAGEYFYRTTRGYTIRTLIDSITDKRKNPAIVESIREKLGVDESTALTVYRCVPEDAMSEFLSNLLK